MSMFCYQCEQASKGTGCTVIGVCGKQPDVAALQDLLVYTMKGIAFWADKARANGAKDQEIDDRPSVSGRCRRNHGCLKDALT